MVFTVVPSRPAVSSVAGPSKYRDMPWIFPLAPLGLQSRFGDKPVILQVCCPQNGTVVLKGFNISILDSRRYPGNGTRKYAYLQNTVAVVSSLRFVLIS